MRKNDVVKCVKLECNDLPKYLIGRVGVILKKFKRKEDGCNLYSVQLDCRKDPVSFFETELKVIGSVIQSNEPCDYCVDRTKPNCAKGRTEYFPVCFKGKRLKAQKGQI